MVVTAAPITNASVSACSDTRDPTFPHVHVAFACTGMQCVSRMCFACTATSVFTNFPQARLPIHCLTPHAATRSCAHVHSLLDDVHGHLDLRLHRVRWLHLLGRDVCDWLPHLRARGPAHVHR